MRVALILNASLILVFNTLAFVRGVTSDCFPIHSYHSLQFFKSHSWIRPRLYRSSPTLTRKSKGADATLATSTLIRTVASLPSPPPPHTPNPIRLRIRRCSSAPWKDSILVYLSFVVDLPQDVVPDKLTASGSFLCSGCSSPPSFYHLLVPPQGFIPVQASLRVEAGLRYIHVVGPHRFSC